MEFLYWLYLTPTGLTVFGTFLVLTAILSATDGRRSRPVRRAPTFDDELALLRRDLTVTRDVRNN